MFATVVVATFAAVQTCRAAAAYVPLWHPEPWSGVVAGWWVEVALALAAWDVAAVLGG